MIRLTVDDLATRRFDELALQDDGTVAFVYSNRNFSRIAWATPGTPGARVVDRGRFEDLALADGRVLYERDGLASGASRGELLLRPLAGEPPRRAGLLPERRRRVGHLDLDATRATWAAQPMRRGYEERPRGPARIVVRGL